MRRYASTSYKRTALSYDGNPDTKRLSLAPDNLPQPMFMVKRT